MSQEWTPPPVSGTPDNVPNYLIPAIISALCCLPLGVVSIIFAAQVNGKVAAGDMAGALNASKKAKMFTFIAFGLWLLLVVCYVLFVVIMGVGMGVAGSVNSDY